MHPEMPDGDAARGPDPDLHARRSHRQLGEQLDLFHFPSHSPGIACWHPRGLCVYRKLEALIRSIYERHRYQEVRTPLVCAHELWARSGHQAKFTAKMLHLEDDHSALKPMNCPGHAELFAHRPRSYRELPLRIAEFGHVHRAEQSGELNGLLRARSFVIDDAHIFCRDPQVDAEVAACLAWTVELHRLFGMEAEAELSLRPQERLGSDELWDTAEQALRGALIASGLGFDERPGEGAFYGPKIDLHVRDALARRWQMGSVQLDYMLPERFDLGYTDERGTLCRPVMVHRALIGSLERFIAVLLEHCDGRLPLWLAPEPLRILPVGGKDGEALLLAVALDAAGVRAGIDAEGPLRGRIRDAHDQRVPLLAVIGAREAAAGQVALRDRDGQRSLPRAELITTLAGQVTLPSV